MSIMLVRALLFYVTVIENSTPMLNSTPNMGVLFMPYELDLSYHSYPQFLHLNCLPGFISSCEEVIHHRYYIDIVSPYYQNQYRIGFLNNQESG